MIHKATQGTSFVDPTYHERRQHALDVGLLWGAYHFGEAGPAVPQVRHFLATVDPAPTDLLALDFEEYSAKTMDLESAELFVDEVYARLGRWVWLYSGQDFCTNAVRACTETPLSRCRLWLARYSTQEPVVPHPWHTWTLWQYTCTGTVPGVQGQVDSNHFHGTTQQLYELWGVEDNSPRV